MSQAASRPPPSGVAESQAFVIIRFRLLRPHGNVAIEDGECLISSAIHSLKDDLQRQLGPPDSQNWYYGGELLSNDRKLMDYGIDGTDDKVIEVRQSNN